ncbi:MAG: NAD(P)H-dependent oxidoreductase subunit E [Gemmataceae bacterium]
MLSESLKEKIKAYLPRYPSKQAVTLPALHLVQDELRCVPLEAIREIADLLDLSPAEVHDTMSFYGIFRDEQHKLGKTRLWVCRGLACALRGGEELLGAVCDKLHVKPGGTSADGKVTVEFAECIGVCEGAPAVMIDDVGRGDVTPDKLDGLLAEPVVGQAASLSCCGEDKLAACPTTEGEMSHGGIRAGPAATHPQEGQPVAGRLQGRRRLQGAGEGVGDAAGRRDEGRRR